MKDAATVERIRKLAIPPAWTDVWICPRANGHLQATGRDARGRKQYRYHADWREVRDETKFGRMIAFGEALPKIRERIDRDLSQRGLGREKVLATVVKLLETTLIRVGNEEYAKQNNSFGLTTLRDRHVDVDGSTLRFEFRGKSGKEHSVEVHDRRLARIVKQCRDLPGQKLFQYLDDDGERQSVSSEDVNAYLRETTGEDFSAKDFRTWGGTVLALSALLEIGALRGRRAGGQPGGGRGDQARRRPARQPAGDLPQVLRAPGGDRELPRRHALDTLQGAVAERRATATTGLRRLEAQLLGLLKGGTGG